MLTTREERELRSLQRRKIREREGRFLAEGVRVVEDLLASDLTVHWIVTASSLEDSDRGQALLDRVAHLALEHRALADHDFERLASTDSPQGVIAVADIPHRALDDLLASAPTRAVLILDAVQDPGNFGTLVRTAEALGAAGVISLPGTVDAWNPKAVRAAVGSSFRQPIVAAPWESAERWLRREGYRILAAEVGGEAVGEEGDRVALVLGNEGAGISAPVLASADRRVGIPLRGRAESLNVAAAAAILFHELTR